MTKKLFGSSILQEDVACMGDRTGAYWVTTRKPEGKRPLVRPRRRWEDNIETHLQKVGWET
jgi:hypothetical protein